MLQTLLVGGLIVVVFICIDAVDPFLEVLQLLQFHDTAGCRCCGRGALLCRGLLLCRCLMPGCLAGCTGRLALRRDLPGRLGLLLGRPAGGLPLRCTGRGDAGLRSPACVRTGLRGLPRVGTGSLCRLLHRLRRGRFTGHVVPCPP